MARLSKIPRCEMRKIMDQKIRDLRKLGYTMGEVAEMLNVSKTTVFNALKTQQDEKPKEQVDIPPVTLKTID